MTARTGVICIVLLLIVTGCDRPGSDAQQSAASGKAARKSTSSSRQISKRLQPVDPALSSILKSKQLVIVTRNAPTTYYYDHDEKAGFEYDLARGFAAHMKVKPRFVVVKTLKEMFDLLEQGKAHLAAAGLTRLAERDEKFLPSKEYFSVKQQVVCRQKGKLAKNVKDLSKVSLAVVARSSYSKRLKTLQKHLNMQFLWKEIENQDTEELLEQVWDKKIDCTIADSNIVSINRRYYPELVVTFDITKAQPVVWYLPRKASELQAKVNAWLQLGSTKKTLVDLNEKYYGFIRIFNYVNTRTFIDRLNDTLPRFEKHFKAAAQQYSHDWALLAAQAYQESYWDPDARSPTGVRGVMMLTQTTAKAMGVANRRDAIQSINGGAKYLRSIKDRLPATIQEPDRTWIALAAYNVGLGHVYDGQRLAKRFKLDPNKWNSLKKVLPLLRRKKYYQTLRYGYARGTEPVRYVARIRDYFDLLLTHKNRKR